MADAASTTAVEILKAARRWVQIRVVLRRTLDSKKATQVDVDRAKLAHQRASDELEGLVMKLERILHDTGRKVPVKRGTPFPWRELIGFVATTAKAVENAIETPPKNVVTAKVVDMKPEK